MSADTAGLRGAGDGEGVNGDGSMIDATAEGVLSGASQSASQPASLLTLNKLLPLG